MSGARYVDYNIHPERGMYSEYYASEEYKLKQENQELRRELYGHGTHNDPGGLTGKLKRSERNLERTEEELRELQDTVAKLVKKVAKLK